MNKIKDSVKEEIASLRVQLARLERIEGLLDEDEPKKAVVPTFEPATGTISERIISVLTDKPMPSGDIISAIRPVVPQSVHSTLQAMKKDGRVYLKGKSWHLKK